jgi:hypothetical protein
VTLSLSYARLMKLHSFLFVALAALLMCVCVACGTAKKAGEPDKPPVPPMEAEKEKPANDMFMDDVKNAVAGQLECPVEEINLVCVKRDQQGECVAVRGDGCNKTVEYQYGDPG